MMQDITVIDTIEVETVEVDLIVEPEIQTIDVVVGDVGPTGPQGPKGDKGDPGQLTQNIGFKFNALTVPPPGDGFVMLDNILAANATRLYISDKAADNSSVTSLFAVLQTGDEVYLQDQNDPQKYARFRLTSAPLHNVGYIALPVIAENTGIAIGNNAAVTVSPARSGATGPQGIPGPAGSTGAQGPKGDQGDIGPQGQKGDTGAQGPKGDKGDTGLQGPAGADSTVPGPPGATGPAGATGATGPAGPAGPAAITVGTTSVVSGTFGNYLFDNSGVVGEKTPTQLTADLSLFTPTLKGLAPASGGGTTNYLRADGTWVAPPGGLTDAPSDGTTYGRLNATWVGVLPLTGGTLTGDLTIVESHPRIILNKSANQTSSITGQMGGTSRWDIVLGDSTAESGVAVGSDFDINRYTNAGAFVDSPLSIKRNTGQVSFPSQVGPTVDPPSGYDAILFLNKFQAALNNVVRGQNGANLNRWDVVLGDNTGETGSNVGSDFKIARYNDAGALIDRPLAITRSTGLATVIGDPTAALGIATKQYVDAASGAGATPPACGRLSMVSGTQLLFKPFNGDRIKIQGVIYPIPAAGISIANTGINLSGTLGQNLVLNTTYLLGLYVSGGVLTPYFTPNTGTGTGTHSTSTTAGNVGTEIVSGSDAISLIGMVRANSSAQFSDGPILRGVLNWFNRRPIGFAGTGMSSQGVSTAYPQVMAGYDVSALTWGDAISLHLSNASGYHNQAANALIQIDIDWNSYPTTLGVVNIMPTAVNSWLPMPLSGVVMLTEGFYTFRILAGVSTPSAVLNGYISGQTFG